jgi:hypothetical protein
LPLVAVSNRSWEPEGEKIPRDLFPSVGFIKIMWTGPLRTKESEWMINDDAENAKWNESLGSSKSASVDSRLVKEALEFCSEKMTWSSRLLTR